MVFGVGHVQRVAVQGHALRMIERGGGEIAVGGADFAGADDGLQFAIEPGDHDAVVIAVGDEQAAAGFVGQNFAGVAQRRLRGFGSAPKRNGSAFRSARPFGDSRGALF